MSYFSSYGGNHSNEQFRNEYRKKLEANTDRSWQPPVGMVEPNLVDQWLEKKRESNRRREYFLPCHIRFGRCPFPQTVVFHAEVCDEMRVNFFHTEPILKERSLKCGMSGDIDKSFPPFSFENTTPYQMARLAKVLDWLCRGDFEKGRPTNLFPHKPDVSIFIKTGSERDKNVYVGVTDGIRSDEMRLWEYEFFPPSGVEAVVKLITEIRNLAIQWYW